MDEAPADPDGGDDRADPPQPRQLVHAAQQHGENDAGDGEGGGPEEEDPVEAGLVEDPLVRQEMALDVAHGWRPRGSA